MDRKSWISILLGGTLLFGGAGLQKVGLETTTAGNAGFITSLYIVLVPLILVLFWREKIYWLSWLGDAIAILGILRLSFGDMLEMARAIFWASQVILVSRVVGHMDVLTFSAGQYLVAGVLNIIVSNVSKASLGGLASGWWTIIYIGVLSTVIGYTLQVVRQKYALPTDAAVLLGMEAVFAALTGFIFLGESMKLVQLVGCGLILMAVVLTQLKSIGARTASI